MASELSEVELVQNETSNDTGVKVEMTSEKDLHIDMLQWARNEFYKNRKIIVKHVQDITVEVSSFELIVNFS